MESRAAGLLVRLLPLRVERRRQSVALVECLRSLRRLVITLQPVAAAMTQPALAHRGMTIV